MEKKKKTEVESEGEKKESERRASSLIRLSQSSCPEAGEVGRIRQGKRVLLVPEMCVGERERERVRARARESEAY